MTKQIRVTKRDGKSEPYIVEKIQRQIEYACDGIDNVSQSLIEISMDLELHDGINTSDIDKLAINAAVGLITSTDGDVNYQYVAGRLQNSVLRKEVYGSFDPPPLIDIVKSGIKKGLYTPELLDWYTEDEWALLDSVVDHTKDERMSHSAIRQFIDKYLVRNRSTGEIIETPQVRYAVAAAVDMHAEPNNRMKRVIEYYKAISNGDFTLPTPVLAGLGTRTKQFSSCVLLRTNDDLKSIFATGEMVANYAAKRAGIGLEVGRVRSLGAPIRNGEIAHTGLVPFLKKWFADMRVASQGGVRGSAATITFPCFHYDFEDLIVLKNNKGVEENRVRHFDYAVVTSAYFWNRYKNQEPITLFCPNSAPEVYEAFYRDQDEFIELYEAMEKDPSVRKRVVPSDDVIGAFLRERTDTGRIYGVYIDNVIARAPVDSEKHPIYQTNLCAEILLPTVPFDRLEDEGYSEITFVGGSTMVLDNRCIINENKNLRYLQPGDRIDSIIFPGDGAMIKPSKQVESVDYQENSAIALCTLGSIHISKFKRPEEMRRAIRLCARGLDNILSYQDFLSPQSKLANDDFRPLGIGITGLAHWHAKRGFEYGSPEALKELSRWMEHFAYYSLESSVDLAAERGPCAKWRDTIYARGETIMDHITPALAEVCEINPHLDWNGLAERAQSTGVRNAFMSAIAPVESSSVCINSTNGIEMPMSLITTKESKGGSLVQVVPDYHRLKDKYSLMWEQPDCIGYLKTAAVMAAFIDQSISTNTFYSPRHFPEGKIPLTLVAKNLMLYYRWGGKTIYYSLVEKTGAKAALMDEKPIETPLPAVEDDDYCEACVL